MRGEEDSVEVTLQSVALIVVIFQLEEAEGSVIAMSLPP